ncbi:hypothetical protein [Campylobacter helveticus]|uniref:hypothetical protein n=1 Tax=Campylobacter helveticus TaxID=28898 RepID=UPI0022EA697F|nr:hypothetical protein [Campylobacter helveticus]
MKKVLKVALASSVLASAFLVGCGDSMEDTNEKDLAYYKTNIEEAKKKLAWCQEKMGISNAMIETEKKSIQDYYDGKYSALPNPNLPFVMKPQFISSDMIDKTREIYVSQSLKEPNYDNCINVILSVTHPNYK